MRLIADHLDWTLIGCLNNRQQTKNQRSGETHDYTAEQHWNVQGVEHVKAKIPQQAANEVAYPCSCGGPKNSANQSKQTGLQAKEQEEISAPVACRFEHGNLSFTPREQNLHRINNTDASDQQSKQASDL